MGPSETRRGGAPIDDRRFAAIWAQHRTPVIRYLQRRLGDDDAEDAAGEVFLRAFRRLDSLRGDAALARPWLFGIAAHVVSESRRAERRRLRLLQRLAAERTLPEADHLILRGDPIHPDLIGGLRKLSAVDRDTLLLVVWGELSYEETAEALAVPIGTVRSRLSRARRQLATLDTAPLTTTARGALDA